MKKLLIAGMLLCLPTFGQTIQHGVILNWTWSGTGTVTYSVYRATVSGAEAKPALVTGLTTTTYTDSSASINVKYYYTVTATVGGVESSPSNQEVAAQIVV